MATLCNNVNTLLEKIMDLEGSVPIWTILCEHIWLIKKNLHMLEDIFTCLDLKLGERASTVALLLAKECS